MPPFGLYLVPQIVATKEIAPMARYARWEEKMKRLFTSLRISYLPPHESILQVTNQLIQPANHQIGVLMLG